jgi:cell division cycle protein 37
MTAGDPRAEAVFSKDVEDTYKHLATRVVEMKKEQEASRGDAEQIQLVPENPDVKISFNVPEGPPPEELRIAEGSEGKIDVEQARKFLQMQWEVYNGFSDELKAALKSQSLEEVNKVLGDMKVAEAEEVVGLLDSAGILNFAEGGVRDETGKDAK